MLNVSINSTGSTTANESLFTYEEGASHSYYFNAEYVPIFLDQDNLVFANATLGQKARDVCGDNKQCLFDIHTTGKVSIGEASKQAVETLVTVINETETPGEEYVLKQVLFSMEILYIPLHTSTLAF